LENKTYVVIVTYNAMIWLEKCLRSIPAKYPVCIVDNHSTDGTLTFINQNHPGIKIFKQDKNLGFGAANNIGIQYALSQAASGVFLLNQDTYLEKDTIEKLKKISQKNQDYGLLSPIHYNGGGNFLDRNFSYYMGYDKVPGFYADALNGKLKEIYDVPFVNAAAWYLPRQTLETIGGFDPIFFHYGEDDNYVQRLLFHKLNIGVIPSSKVFHDRQGRQNSAIIPFTSAYYKNAERKYKLILANIAVEDIDIQYIILKKALFNKALKSIMKGKLFAFNGLLKERSLLISWMKEIRESRELNKKIGKHYL